MNRKYAKSFKLSEAFKEQIPKPDPAAPEKVVEAFEYIAGHIDSPTLKVANIKEACGIDQANFSQVFRHYTGYPPRGFITHYRIELSKRLIEHCEDITIGEIAHLVGYRSDNSFCHTFKNKTGCRPSQWRKGDC